MEKFKELFGNSRLGIGVAIGTTVGYLIGGKELDGIFGAAIVMSVIVVIVENMFFKTKKKK